MAFQYTQQLIQSAFTYSGYREQIDETLSLPPKDEAAEKMRPYIAKNVALMDQYDKSYKLSDSLKAAVDAAPSTTWLVLTEGWCGDAAFNIPMMNVIEKAIPGKVQLRLLFRDSNLDVMDANLTDGGRSIPKLIVLSNTLTELGHWGPRPEGLQSLMKQWKSDGLILKDLIPKVHDWYNTDATHSLQQELITMIKAYS